MKLGGPVVMRRLALVVWLVICLGGAAPLLAQPHSLVLSSESERQAWSQAADEVLRGQFTEVHQDLGAALADVPGDSSLRTLAVWVNDYQALQRQREGFRKEDYDYYVGKTQKHLEADELLDALENAQSATYYASDEDAVRNEPWYPTLRERAADQANDLRRKGQWVDAANLYYYLHQLEEDEEAYEEGFERCQHHARLELVYGSDSHWEEMVEGIHPIIVANTLRRIKSDYVREPDFKAFAVAGLESLLTLARTPELGKQEGFERLSDRNRTTRFTGQLESLLADIQQREQLSERDVMGAFNDLLVVNERTLQLPREVLVFEFMDAALEELDRFSNIIWPAEMDEFKKQTVGEFVGVGIQITQEAGALKVVTPLEDTPAYRAGIQPGDFITAVDGESLKGISITRAIKQITGERGTQVVLTVQRGSADPFDVTLVREVIHIQTVKGFQRNEASQWEYTLDQQEGIGYVRVTSFTESSAADLRNILQQLQHHGLRGLILDLRFNPGGLLRAATEVSDLFLREGVVVSTRGAHAEPWESTARPAKTFTDFPIVVLINEASASASEIVAGALQENNHRALVLGERSFGKGSVQYLLSVAGRSAYLKLTTAQYYLPSGRSLHREEEAETWGVEPDILVELTPNEMRKVWSLWRDRDILPGIGQESADDAAGEPAEPDEPADHADEDDEELIDLDDRPDIDPQLEAGLLVMRVKLLSDQDWPQLGPARLAEADAKQR